MSDIQGRTASRCVVVTGSRKWVHHHAVWRALAAEDPLLVIHGGCATGADRDAELWCRRMNVDSHAMRAKWEWSEGDRGRLLNPEEGPMRNRRMLLEYPLAIVLAFPLPDGKGTQDCMRQARALGRIVKEFKP